MMKKWIAVIMIAALTCTLFACTTSDEGSSSSQMESSSSVSESSSEVESSSSEAEPTTPTDESGEDATSTDPSSTTPTVDNTNAGQGANSKKRTRTLLSKMACTSASMGIAPCSL